MNYQHQELIQQVERQWQYRYIRLLESKSHLRLFYFLGDFSAYCSKIVKQIIHSSSKFVQIDQFDYRYAFIKPGEKMYLKDNIIFRIAKFEMKDGKYNTDKIKLLTRQFTSNNYLNDLLINLRSEKRLKYRVPLACLVDYLGYKAFCQADTPCQGLDTIVYGPTTEKYFKHNENIEKNLLTIGQHLNIKPYEVQASDNTNIVIPFSINTEVHYAKMEKYDEIRRIINPKSYLYEEVQPRYKKQQYYIYNLEKIWPMYIDKDLQKNIGYLRPQYVLAWQKRLSNVVFLNIAASTDYKSQLEIADACKTLKQDQTSLLVQKLDSSELILIDSQGITTAFHQYGINLRFMGAVAKKSRFSHVKGILKIEMIARTIKKIFYSTVQSHTEINYYKQALADLLNLIFVLNKQGQYFYKQVLYKEILDYYQYQIEQYPPAVQGGGLLHAICYNLRVKIKITDYGFFLQQFQKIPFQPHSILEFCSAPKCYKLETTQLPILCSNYKQKKKQKKFIECLKQLQILISINNGLYNQKNCMKPLPQAIYYAEAAQILSQLGEQQKSFQYANNSLKCLPEKHAQSIKSLCILIKYFSNIKNLNRALQQYDKALSSIVYHVGNNHPLMINVYNVLAFEYLKHNESQKCEKILKKSFEVCSQTLGYLHTTCSQILMQLSFLPLAPSVTLNFLNQCLNIVENLKIDPQIILSVSQRIAQQYAQIGDSKYIAYYGNKSKNWYLQLSGLQRLMKYENVLQLCAKPPKQKRNQAREASFATQKFLYAYTRILDWQSVLYLYKIYVACKQKIVTKQEGLAALIPLGYHLNVTILIEEAITLLLQNAYQLLDQPQFYLDPVGTISRMRDSRLKRIIWNYIWILSILGHQKVQWMLYNTKLP